MSEYTEVGWLFEFHGTSTTMGYSMPYLVHIYESYMIFDHFFYMNSLFLHKPTFLLNSCFGPFDPQVGNTLRFKFEEFVDD